MPYIKLADRPMFNTMIDGLIPKIKGFDYEAIGNIAGSLVICALTPAPFPDGIGIPEQLAEIIKSLAKRVRVRGDANYCVCRIVLESMKPEIGWGYHSLSDTVMALDAAINLVYDVRYTKKLEDAKVAGAISVLGDVITEIERRLLSPYEDTAILKNGDLACFANESFALKPLNMSGAYSGRDVCGCNRAPCGCKSSDIVESGREVPRSWPRFLDDRLVAAIEVLGEAPVPPITEALTQKQCDDIDQERK